MLNNMKQIYFPFFGQMQVLYKVGCIDPELSIQIKGQVACAIE